MSRTRGHAVEDLRDQRYQGRLRLVHGTQYQDLQFGIAIKIKSITPILPPLSNGSMMGSEGEIFIV